MDKRKFNKGTKGNKGGAGYSGENREKSATLKGLVMDWAIKIMNGEDENKKKEVALKILPSCIPQEMRHSGSEENNTPIPILNVSTNNSDQQNTETNKEN